MFVCRTNIEENVLKLIEKDLYSLGYLVVRVRMNKGKKFGNLQVMLDRIDENPVSIDDCERASRQVSAILDAADIISHGYNLEVSSPGINRPLTKIADFEKFKGHIVKLVSDVPIWSDSKKIYAILKGLQDDNKFIAVQVEEAQEELKINLTSIKEVKLHVVR